jgi:hypothetical protein
VDQVCDSAYGQIFPVPPANAPFSGTCNAGSQCAAPQNVTGGGCAASTTCTGATIGLNGTYDCAFTASQPENKTVTNIASATVHGSSSGTHASGSSNSVTVVSNEAPSTATVTKGVVSTLAACATERYSVTVHNSSASGTDENLTLTALNDTFYGDITTLHDHVLATTCAIPTGGSSLPVGGSDYTCTFDAQFCSAIDTNGCISETDTINATLSGDEAADTVTVSTNTITVKECLQRTVTP